MLIYLFIFLRFDNDFIKDNFEVSRICGKKGSGYIFDTHALHKGTIEGSNDRITIIIEFHPKNKVKFVLNNQFQLPCPSGDQRPFDENLKFFGIDPTIEEKNEL